MHELNESEDDNTAGPATVTWRRFWLLSPSPGDVLAQGSVLAVTWNSTLLLADFVDIELSTDVGASWSPIATGTPNDGSFDWLITCDSSTKCLLRIRDQADSVSDVTEGTFAVEAPTGLFGGGCSTPLAFDPEGYARGSLPGGALLLLLTAACMLARTSASSVEPRRAQAG